MIEKVNRKSMKIRFSGRSSDYISPSFGFGCLYNCHYCYMKRHKPEGLTVATNITQILSTINTHVAFCEVEKPNQTDSDFVTYDISCNEDFALHNKYYDWKSIFNFFKNHPKAKATFATKYVPKEFLNYNPNNKIRIRFSLMPEVLRKLVEPNTSLIIERIKAIDIFIKAGYDVHINFSPVIVYKTWLKDYEELFILVNNLVKNKDKVKCEVIFLTHNDKKHIANVDSNNKSEKILWQPSLQEYKQSQYGGRNLRYKSYLKFNYIQQFKQIHNKHIKWCIIRYIF